VLERQVLELPPDARHAEAVGERRVEVASLERDAGALVRFEMLERPHVVQAIGELDDDDARVLGDREQQLAVVLDLSLLRRPERPTRDLRQPIHDRRDLLTDLALDVALVAIGDEMFVSLGRTSKSPIIYEVLDYCCGLTDAKAQLIAQGNGVALFLGTLTFAVQAVLDKFGIDGLAEGDIVVTNDPYSGGGTHLSDVSMIMPILHDGRIIAFAANKAHWTEVGGKYPGSWTTDATELYQEGRQFANIKLFNQAQTDQARGPNRRRQIWGSLAQVQPGSFDLLD